MYKNDYVGHVYRKNLYSGHKFSILETYMLHKHFLKSE